MASLLPRREAVDHVPRHETEVSISPDREGSGDVLQALTSDTARDVVAALRDDPQTTSDLADATDTSLQNVRYHLERLREAGLVEPVDTWYSSRGSPMTVYALTTERLVVRFGPDDDAPPEQSRPAGG